MRARRSCHLVGGSILRCGKFIHVVAVLSVLVAVTGLLGLVTVAKSAADGGISTTPAVTSTTATTTTEPASTEQTDAVLLQQVNRGIVKYRGEVWHWQYAMGRRRTPSHYQTAMPHSLTYAQWVLHLWQQRAQHWQSAARRWMQQRILVYRRNVRIWRLVMGQTGSIRTLAASGSLEEEFRRWHKTEQQVHQQWVHPPLLADWLCIHRYEGSWSDPNEPYWGGLQMDLTFQQTYGSWLLKHKGTADHWTPLEQIWTALKAYRSRGFNPWPNTARYCGLLG